MEFLKQVELALASWANQLPLEIFMFAGSIVEEVIAPLPSPLVPATAGSVAALQNRPLGTIAWLAAFGATGKVIGAWVLYLLADKAEDIVVGKFGKFLGVSHKKIEGIGKHLQGGRRDLAVLTLLRALPVVSSTLVSVVCGTIKVNKRVYTLATFIGTYFRDLLFLYFGFAGLSAFSNVIAGLENTESKLQLISLSAIFVFLTWLFLKKRRG